MIKIKTYLPIFNGFYGTFFEADNEENELDHINSEREEKGLTPVSYEDCDWDYKTYREEVVSNCVVEVEDELSNIFNGGVKIINEGLVSPKFYNFSNDSINVEIELSDDAFLEMMTLLEENDKEFKKFIKDNYTSCDGFISSHSNIHAEWLEALKSKDQNLLSHKLGSVLGFILNELNGYDHVKLSENIDYQQVYVTNYSELVPD
jgi:hypothetical protein